MITHDGFKPLDEALEEVGRASSLFRCNQVSFRIMSMWRGRAWEGAAHVNGWEPFSNRHR